MNKEKDYTVEELLDIVNDGVEEITPKLRPPSSFTSPKLKEYG